MTGGREVDARAISALAAIVLCAGAAVLILAILIGGSKEVEGKALIFAFSFALFTLPAAAGVYLARERPGLVLLGAATTLAAVAAFISIVVAFWQGRLLEGGGDGKTAAVLTLVSIGTGQVSLIFALGTTNDSRTMLGLRILGLLPIAALTVIGAEDISNHGPATSPKVYAVLGVLYVLSIVLLPLVDRATRVEYEAPPIL